MNASLIYDKAGREILEVIYGQYLGVAQEFSLPILLMTNTRRANKERVLSSPYKDKNIMRDYADFLKEIVAKYNCEAYIGGYIKASINRHNLELISLSETKTCYSKKEFHEIIDKYKIKLNEFYKYIQSNPDIEASEKDKFTLDYISKMYRDNDFHQPTISISNFLYNFLEYKLDLSNKNLYLDDALKCKQVCNFSEIVNLLDKKSDNRPDFYLPNKHNTQILMNSSLKDIVSAINQIESDNESFSYVLNSGAVEDIISEIFLKSLEVLSIEVLISFYKYHEVYFMLNDYQWEILRVLTSNKDKLKILEKDMINLKIPKEDIIKNAFEYSKLLNVSFNDIQSDQSERTDLFTFLSNKLDIYQKQLLLDVWDIFSNINSAVWRVFCITALLDRSNDYKISQALNSVFLKHGLII